MTLVSTLGQALDQIERLKGLQERMGLLQTQLATGKKTDLYKGLGTDVIYSQRARANFSSLDTYLNNITIADRRIRIMESSLGQVQDQAENMLEAIEVQTQTGEYEIASVGTLAGNILDVITDLLNQKDGERYLFAGAENLQQAMYDNGALDTYTRQQITDWVNGSLDNDQLIASYTDQTALTDTIVGFNAQLSSGNARNVTVRVDDNAEVDYTVFANEDPLRDIIVVMSMIKNLDSVLDEVTLEDDDPPTTVTAPGATQDEKNQNFYTIFNDLAKMMSRALDGVDDLRFRVSDAQAQIKQIADSHKFEKNTMLSVIADVEDVDLNEVAVQINTLTVQLEASYRVTALLSTLNLTTVLGAA